jgi:hypothetical protein
MAPTKLELAYNLVAEVAAPSANEGLKKPRAILLLWFLRHVYGIDDLEAYEFICDGDKDQGVDGLYLEESDPNEDFATLHVLQSKYPEAPKNVGVNEIKNLIGTLEPLLTANGIKQLIAQGVEPELATLIKRFDLVERLEAGKLRTRGIHVIAGELTPEARALVRTTNLGKGYPYLTAYDVFDLAPIVEAFKSPTTVKAQVIVHCDKNNRFITGTPPQARIAVCKVPVSDIVNWPGILDRTLFDLNVRRELSPNRVRHALDTAVQRKADHPNFLAYHNGLTVVCRKFDETDHNTIVVHDLSVVNGAQSTVAFKDNEGFVTPDLFVVVKFVEIAATSQVAREVAVRSNTQNPVNARNLRARDGIQLRLVQEFKDQFPLTSYETRPDASLQQPPATRIIQNDLAAQMLTAIFHQRPWLAVKRLSLFEAETYPEVFTPQITAGHIMFADLIYQRVQNAKEAFPEDYRRSWRLTQLVAIYLVGQMLRTDDAGQAMLQHPSKALKDGTTTGIIDNLVKVAVATLKVRRDGKLQEKVLDDFKVDFKRESELRELARKAREHYLVTNALKA